MTTVVDGHADGSLLKTNIEDESYDALVSLAKRHERSLAGEIRIAIRKP